jgi:hypothetical protein
MIPLLALATLAAASTQDDSRPWSGKAFEDTVKRAWLLNNPSLLLDAMDVTDPLTDKRFHEFLKGLWERAKTKPEARTFGWWLYKGVFPRIIIVYRKGWIQNKGPFSILAVPSGYSIANKEDWVKQHSWFIGSNEWFFPYGADEQDYTGALLNEVNWSGRGLNGKNLSNSVFRDADLSNANLQGANLQGSQLRYANLSGANLRDANLENTDFLHSNLSNAKFANSRFDTVSFDDADLRGATFENVTLKYTIFYNAKRNASDSKIPGWTRGEDNLLHPTRQGKT